jgi:hypothetical protein
MTQHELPRFVFHSSEEEYHTGEIIAWMPKHCMIRLDCMDEHDHPLLTRLFPLSQLDDERTLFFATRDELNLWLAYLESNALEEEPESKSALN